MDDPFQSPGIEDGAGAERSLALVGAGCLYAISAVSTVLLLLGLLADLIYLLLALARMEGVVAVLLGALCREGFLLVVAAGTLQGAQALRAPQVHGTAPVARRELERIYASERLADRTLPPSDRYAAIADHGLVEVWHGIDREAAASRFAELLAEVKRRVEHAHATGSREQDEADGPAE